MQLHLISWPVAANAFIGGGIVIALQALGRAVVTDAATRIIASVWGIRAFDWLTGWVLRHPIWSGTWEVTWQVKSPNFSAVNPETGRLYRCLNNVAFEGSGTTIDGNRIPYAFVGRLSRDKTILTGTWFDRRGSGVGYHGVFQLRLQGAGSTTASGKWAGFSERKPIVKSDSLQWIRLAE